ncbi:MAG: hypothetical protein MJ197_02570 [Bacteroidales bacterium]|nr:hypothetical protein [Bacteroidales bacterium]
MDKYVQKKTKTNWFKTIFVFVLLSVFSFAAFAGNEWELTDNEIVIPYDEYGATNASGESIEWQAGNTSVLLETVAETTGNTAWVPEVGEVFTVTVEGFADFTGKIAISLADRREEVDYWATLASEYTMDVVEGENFSETVTCKITHIEKDGNGLYAPELVFTARPNITSTDHSFSKEDKHLYLNDFMVEYAPANKYAEVVAIPYFVYGLSSDSDSDSDMFETNNGAYQQILLETVAETTGNTAWIPEIGEVFNVTMEGFADFTGKLLFSLADTREDVGYWATLANDDTFDVVEGENFSKTITFKITHTEKNGIGLFVPEIVFTALPNITSTDHSFSKEDKHLYLNDFMVEYTPANKYADVVEMPYDIFGASFDSDPDSDEFRNNNGMYQSILFEIVDETTGNTAWVPEVGEVFTVTVEGFADFTGKIAISLADRREEVDYWATLASEYTMDVVEGENFSETVTCKITHIEKDGNGLYAPELVFTARPNITSTDHSFSKDDKHLYLNNFIVEYTPAPTYADVVEMPYDIFGTSHEFKTSRGYMLVKAVVEATGDTATAWLPEIGEVFTITVEGFADFSGKLIFSDRKKMFDDYTMDVVEGETFSKSIILKITKIADTTKRIIPQIVLTARPNQPFSIDDKHLYLNKFMAEYTPALNPEDYSTILKLDKFPYSDNTWLYVYADNAILTDVTTNAGYEWEYVSDGDKYIIHTKGVADFTGTIGFYAINSRGDWNLCSDFQNHSVEYGKEFEFYDTLIITDASTTMQLQLDAICDDNTDPASKHLYLNEYSVSYSNQYCKVIVYSNDVTDFYNIFTENGETYKSLSNGRGVIEGVEPETVWENDFEAGYAFILAKGSLVTITATPTEYGEFYSWSDGSTDATITITVPDTDTLELMANFRQLEFINYGTFDGPEFKLRALDTTAIYLPEVIQASYGTPLTYKIVKENELVPTKISNDTLYFMPPVGAIGNHISISVEATLPNETSRVSEFRTSFYPVQRDSLFPTPQIALVTVSKESGKNLVVWQKFETDKIDHYNIYRETEVAGEYKKIGEVPYSETSIYEDTEADPLVRAWRYKISASPVDTRYTESELSKAHKTIHLTKNMGMNNTYNLIWDKYEGLDFSTFVVIRDYKVGTSEIYTDTIAEIPSNVNSYTDLEPQKRTISYYVAIKLKDTVDVNEYLKAEIGPFVLAMSNIAEIENEHDGNPTAIDNMGKAIVVYAANKTIYVKHANGPATVYNVSGALMAQSQEVSETQEIPVEKAGLYFVKIGRNMYKVIVQ